MGLPPQKIVGHVGYGLEVRAGCEWELLWPWIPGFDRLGLLAGRYAPGKQSGETVPGSVAWPGSFQIPWRW